MRRTWLDAVRGGTVLLVLVYHVFYMFNAAGVLGGVGPFSAVQPQDVLLYAVYPWIMVLLFVVAGMCARYALERTDRRSYLRARTVKLLIPSTLGLFVLQWLVGYGNILIGGGLDTIPPALRWPIFAVSGTGPLWFLQVLWVATVVLCLVHGRQWWARLTVCGARCSWPLTVALGILVLWGGAQVGNLPVITTYRFGIYLAAFFLGYLVLSHEPVLDRLGRARSGLLAAAAVLGVCFVMRYFGESYVADDCLHALLTNAYAWVATLAILTAAQAWCDRPTAFTTRMAQDGFSIYVVHYLLIVWPCWALKTVAALPAAAVYPLALATVLLGAPLLAALLRRIPFVRFAVFGIRAKRN